MIQIGNTEHSCQSCLYFRPEEKDSGDCVIRARPPVKMETQKGVTIKGENVSINISTYYYFPKMNKFDHCGEYIDDTHGRSLIDLIKGANSYA